MEKSKKKAFEGRRETLKRKASELSSLCNVDVCVLVVGPTGDLSSWPEDSAATRSAVGRYFDACKNNKRIKKNHHHSLNNASLGLSVPLWDEQLLRMSEDSLVRLYGSLESKIRDIDARIGFLSAKQNPSSAGFEDDHHQLNEWLQNIWDPMEQPNADSPTLREDDWSPMEQPNADSFTLREDDWSPMEKPYGDSPILCEDDWSPTVQPNANSPTLLEDDWSPMEQPNTDSPTLCEDDWSPMEQPNADSPTLLQDDWSPTVQPSANSPTLLQDDWSPTEQPNANSPTLREDDWSPMKQPNADSPTLCEDDWSLLSEMLWTEPLL